MIPIDEHELTTDHMTKQFMNIMELVEAKIGNAKQPLFDGTEPKGKIIVAEEFFSLRSPIFSKKSCRFLKDAADIFPHN